MEVEFYFSNDTFLALSKTLVTFPKIQESKQMPIIRFGNTIDSVSYENIENLLSMTVGRVEIDLTGTDMEQIIKRSKKYRKLLSIDDVNELPKQDKEYIFDLYE